MLLSMLFAAFIAAIFHEVAAITFPQFDVIHFCDATVCAAYVGLCLYCAVHVTKPKLQTFSLSQIEDLTLDRNSLCCSLCPYRIGFPR